MLGTATFVGYLAGSQLSDVLFGSATVDRTLTNRMFWMAGVVALLGMPPPGSPRATSPGRSRPTGLPLGNCCGSTSPARCWQWP